MNCVISDDGSTATWVTVGGVDLIEFNKPEVYGVDAAFSLDVGRLTAVLGSSGLETMSCWQSKATEIGWNVLRSGLVCAARNRYCSGRGRCRLCVQRCGKRSFDICTMGGYLRMNRLGRLVIGLLVAALIVCVATLLKGWLSIESTPSLVAKFAEPWTMVEIVLFGFCIWILWEIGRGTARQKRNARKDQC